MIVSREKIPLPNEQAVAELLRKLLNKEDSIAKDREHFWVISLDTKNKVKFVELVSLGTVNTCLVSPREVFRRALKKGAVSIIIGHNHPSGDPTPERRRPDHYPKHQTRRRTCFPFLCWTISF